MRAIFSRRHAVMKLFNHNSIRLISSCIAKFSEKNAFEVFNMYGEVFLSFSIRMYDILLLHRSPAYKIDMVSLEHSYKTLQKQLHPDLHHNAVSTLAVSTNSIDSSMVNHSYQARGSYYILQQIIIFISFRY